MTDTAAAFSLEWLALYCGLAILVIALGIWLGLFLARRTGLLERSRWPAQLEQDSLRVDLPNHGVKYEIVEMDYHVGADAPRHVIEVREVEAAARSRHP